MALPGVKGVTSQASARLLVLICTLDICSLLSRRRAMKPGWHRAVCPAWAVLCVISRPSTAGYFSDLWTSSWKVFYSQKWFHRSLSVSVTQQDTHFWLSHVLFSYFYFIFFLFNRSPLTLNHSMLWFIVPLKLFVSSCVPSFLPLPVSRSHNLVTKCFAFWSRVSSTTCFQKKGEKSKSSQSNEWRSSCFCNECVNTCI